MSEVKAFAFLAGTDIYMIGQFGVGFYSAYLAADNVQVISKSNYNDQYLCESSTGGPFTIKNDNSEPIGRGTIIMYHMKEDRAGYLEEKKMKEIINKYSQFTSYPTELILKKEQKKQLSEEFQKHHKRNNIKN